MPVVVIPATQTVRPAGIPSGEAVGTPTVDTTSIRPTGIPSSATFGTAKVTPAEIHPAGIPPGHVGSPHVRFTIPPVPATKQILVREKPPLRLSVAVRTPAGATFRWAKDGKPSDVPGAISFATSMPGGFDHASLTLDRNPRRDYPDLEELAHVVIEGVGSPAWEGRLESSPRQSGDQMNVQPGLVGWQSALTDNAAGKMIYVDQAKSSWADASTGRQLALLQGLGYTGYSSSNVGPDWSSGLPAMITAYDQVTVDPATDTTPQKVLQDTLGAFWTAVAVYGRHGLPLYGGGSQTVAPGVLASDVLADILERFVSELKFSTGPHGTIKPSTFIIPQLAFLQATAPGEMVRQAVRFELLDWAVWDRKTFYANAFNARGSSWVARVGPSKLQEQGPDIARLFNGVVVQYSDVAGTDRTVGPPGSQSNTIDPDLQDLDPENPLNQAGIVRWATLQMQTSTLAGAAQIGKTFNAAQKIVSTAGQAELNGWVQDVNGIWWPAWVVRSGDTICFLDSGDTSFRRIVKTDYNDDQKTNTVTLDSPPQGLQALLERLSVVLVSYGFS